MHIIFFLSSLARLRTLHIPHSNFTSKSSVVPPKITPFGFARDVNVGERTSIQCVVGTGDLPLTFVWLKDDVPIDPASGASEKDLNGLHGIEMMSSAADDGYGSTAERPIMLRKFDDFTSALSITNVSRSLAGIYTCKVQNDAAVAMHSAQLRVNGKLAIQTSILIAPLHPSRPVWIV